MGDSIFDKMNNGALGGGGNAKPSNGGLLGALTGVNFSTTQGLFSDSQGIFKQAGGGGLGALLNGRNPAGDKITSDIAAALSKMNSENWPRAEQMIGEPTHGVTVAASGPSTPELG